MHKLDPIERLPDGSLFRLTPGQLRSVRDALRAAACRSGECLLLDGVCPQSISRSLLCRWFRRAMLPQQPKLERAILSPKNSAAAKSAARASSSTPAGQNTAPPAPRRFTASRRRNPPANGGRRKEQFRVKTPLNYKPSRTAKAARQYDFPHSPEIEFYLST